jgi:hypothetical protein
VKVLLHICCATCALGALEALREEDAQITGYFYNPNIHPLLEFRKRIKALKVLREGVREPLLIEETYGLQTWIEQVYDRDPARRCVRCYELRLRRAAKTALEQGCDAFTTTLLISRHQPHETVWKVGRRVGEEHGVPCLYRDFRPYMERAVEAARKRHLYRQQYCGCCMSEYERFKDTTRELYKPDLVRRKKASTGNAS